MQIILLNKQLRDKNFLDGPTEYVMLRDFEWNVQTLTANLILCNQNAPCSFHTGSLQ